MNVLKFFGVDEWKSFLLVCMFLMFVTGFSLLSRFVLWFLFVIGVLGSILSFYMVFFYKHKDKEDVKELFEYVGGVFKK